MAPYTPNSNKETAALRTLNKKIWTGKVTAEELETTLKDFQELDRRNWKSRTSPLRAAAILGSTSHIAKCLEKGINIDSIDSGLNAIEFSIYLKEVDVTKYLLDKGATLAVYNVIMAIAEKNEVILEACLTTFGQQKNIKLQDLLKLSTDDTTMLRQFLMICPEVISFNDFDILLRFGFFPLQQRIKSILWLWQFRLLRRVYGAKWCSGIFMHFQSNWESAKITCCQDH
jgi:hypothetical protein